MSKLFCEMERIRSSQKDQKDMESQESTAESTDQLPTGQVSKVIDFDDPVTAIGLPDQAVAISAMSNGPAFNPRHISETNEHHTPPHVIEAARRSLVSIDLDPATTEFANASRVKAKSIYTAETNGFDQVWHGAVFINPPGGNCDWAGKSVYSLDKTVGKGWSCLDKFHACGHAHKGVRSSQKAWWQKLAFEWEQKRTTAAIFVGFSVEILQTTQVDAVGQIPLEFPICVPSRRLAYFKEIGGKFIEGKSPPHASVLIFLPPPTTITSSTLEGIKRFVEAFSPIGHVSVPWRWR